jgi:hypothetical protein
MIELLTKLAFFLNVTVPINKKIQTIFNSYTGRTFIFYDNYYYYVEWNECTMKPKQHGIINELFPGVSTYVNDVFRYRNGILYFFKKKDNKAILYEFDQFSNMLIKAAPFDFSTFNIHCPILGILEQLKTLLNKLASYSLKLIKIILYGKNI